MGHPGGLQEPGSGESQVALQYGLFIWMTIDPFLGSGTTVVAAQKLKRNGIGYEINPDYIKMAKKNLSQKSLAIL